jgi:hypothetical protein
MDMIVSRESGHNSQELSIEWHHDDEQELITVSSV